MKMATKAPGPKTWPSWPPSENDNEEGQHGHLSRLYRDLATFGDSCEREGDTFLENPAEKSGGGAFEPTEEI